MPLEAESSRVVIPPATLQTRCIECHFEGLGLLKDKATVARQGLRLSAWTASGLDAEAAGGPSVAAGGSASAYGGFDVIGVADSSGGIGIGAWPVASGPWDSGDAKAEGVANPAAGGVPAVDMAGIAAAAVAIAEGNTDLSGGTAPPEAEKFAKALRDSVATAEEFAKALRDSVATAEEFAKALRDSVATAEEFAKSTAIRGDEAEGLLGTARFRGVGGGFATGTLRVRGGGLLGTAAITWRQRMSLLGCYAIPWRRAEEFAGLSWRFRGDGGGACAALVHEAPRLRSQLGLLKDAPFGKLPMKSLEAHAFPAMVYMLPELAVESCELDEHLAGKEATVDPWRALVDLLQARVVRFQLFVMKAGGAGGFKTVNDEQLERALRGELAPGDIARPPCAGARPLTAAAHQGPLAGVDLIVLPVQRRQPVEKGRIAWGFTVQPTAQKCKMTE
ncbi:hypothetical protein CYMTET_32248 [Cymbomonas tetramitiformis]|uniref:Uncharacterized protein n=1 Tax=Cymbomonas tetramitiformis TaxID=36881 RepID=A0AAE0KS19_9CHLO|nr:hypothetical protein CYMTET_32248 [Cymbomonas tetramitiformis]